MQHGDWRLQPIGRPDQLHLVQAAYLLAAIVLLWILAKQLIAEERRATRTPSRRRSPASSGD